MFSFPYFNVVQSKIFDDVSKVLISCVFVARLDGVIFVVIEVFPVFQVLYSDKAIVLSAPTGSGKTVMFELAIIRILIQQQSRPSSHYKVVYSEYDRGLETTRVIVSRLR